MYTSLYFEIAIFVFVQHILAVFGDRPKPLNPCPNDFLRIYNKCYYFSTEYETWERANWRCADKNSTLVVLTNRNQNNALRQFLIKGYFAHAPRWMGGQYDFKSAQWKWIYNGKPIRYNHFNKDEQRNGSLEWHCLIIDPTANYSWNSRSCFEKNYYICQSRLMHRKNPPSNFTNLVNGTTKEDIQKSNNSTEQRDSQPGYYIINAEDDDRYKNKGKRKKPKRKKFLCPKDYILVGKKCYFPSREKENWNDAYFNCQDMKSELAVLKNEKQDKRLRAKVNRLKIPTEKRWLGGHFDWMNKKWKWAATGVVLPVEPLGTKHDLEWVCVIWDPDIPDRWSSESCTIPMYYMCQRPAKPTVRITPASKLSKSLSKNNPVSNHI